jgi:hypothetical protein
LHRLIDWLMPLPDDLKIQFRIQLQQRLPDKSMPHITLFEELAGPASKKRTEKRWVFVRVFWTRKGLVKGRRGRCGGACGCRRLR